MNRCSRIGPRLSTGKNVSAPTIRITLIKSTVKSGVVTGKVPSEGGTYFLPARFPAIASMGMIIRNRPASMVSPIVTSYHDSRDSVPLSYEIGGACRAIVGISETALVRRVRSLGGLHLFTPPGYDLERVVSQRV